MSVVAAAAAVLRDTKHTNARVSWRRLLGSITSPPSNGYLFSLGHTNKICEAGYNWCESAGTREKPADRPGSGLRRIYISHTLAVLCQTWTAGVKCDCSIEVTGGTFLGNQR